MKEGDTISEYFARVMVVVIMRNLGEEMSDAKRVEMIVRTLVEEFTFVVCGIEESNVIKDHAVKVEGRWNSSGGREAKGEEDTKWSAGYVFDEKKNGVGRMTNKISFFTWERSEDGINGNDENMGEAKEGEDKKKERLNLLNGNEVKNPIVPGTRLTKEGDGNKVDPTLYKQLIGSLMYITSTRPDMMYTVCLLSRYMADPRDQHMQAAKRLLRYLKGTLGFGVFYKRKAVGELTVYTDSDYAGDIDDRRGYAFLLSGGAVAWASKKQPVVTLSTTEAEFVAAGYCACQCVWMRRILEKFGLKQSGSTTIMCDNSSAIKLSKNPVLHGRSKHIDVRFHFLRDLTKDGVVKLVHCGTNEQVADILTKPLRLVAFVRLKEKLGECNKIN